jgi:hypothetical protein
MKTTFRKVKKQRKPSRRRLNRNIAKTYCYEVRGVDEDDGFRSVVAWFFKDEARKCTYLVRITCFRDCKSFDPEAQFVIDSVRFP